MAFYNSYFPPSFPLSFLLLLSSTLPPSSLLPPSLLLPSRLSLLLSGWVHPGLTNSVGRHPTSNSYQPHHEWEHSAYHQQQAHEHWESLHPPHRPTRETTDQVCAFCVEGILIPRPISIFQIGLGMRLGWGQLLKWHSEVWRVSRDTWLLSWITLQQNMVVCSPNCRRALRAKIYTVWSLKEGENVYHIMTVWNVTYVYSYILAWLHNVSVIQLLWCSTHRKLLLLLLILAV